MYSTSEKYKEQINKPVRNVSYVRIRFGVIDPEIIAGSTITDNGHLFYSNANDIDTGIGVESTYSTLEKNRWILDGKTTLARREGQTPYLYQGYVGDRISGADGYWSDYPAVIVNFNSFFNLAGLTFLQDDTTNNFAEIIKITAYTNETVILEETLNITGTDYIYDHGINECNKIKVEFIKSNIPGRRPRLFGLILGLYRRFYSEDISSVAWKRESDLIGSKLPIENFSFTLIDPAREFNPDNPTGVWRYIVDQQSVVCEIGYELEDGNIEWITCGNMKTSGEASFDDAAIPKATVKTVSQLTFLTDTYKKGLYYSGGRSLFDLANDVLDDAGVDQAARNISDTLKNIYTNAPLPLVSHRECLQLIANAGMCVLYTDRLGKVSMQPLPTTMSDFYLDLSKTLQRPTIKKYPPLYAVDVNVYSRVVQTGTEELANAEVEAVGNTTLEITYSEGIPSGYTVTGSVSVVGAPAYYANCAILTVTGTGTVKIMGQRITVSSKVYSKFFGVTGDRCPMENPLITTDVMAANYALWVGGILTLRNEYTTKDRGYPEIDLGDLITAQTGFSENMPVYILGNEITFNGTLSGTLKYLKGEA